MRAPIARLAPFAGAALLLIFVATIGDMRTRGLLLNTLLLAVASCAIATPVSLFLAFFLARTDVFGRRLHAALLGALALTPLFLITGGWQAAMGISGWWSAITGAPALLTGWPAAILIHSIAAVPWQVGIIAVGLWSVEPELEEDALLLGGAWRTVRSVTLRRTSPAIAAAVAWTFLQTASEMTVTDVFMIRTFAEELYTETAIGLEPGEAPLRFAPRVALCAAIVLVAIGLSSQLSPMVRAARRRRMLRFSLGKARLAATAGVALVMFMLVAPPVASLFWKAGVRVTLTDAGYVRDWSVAKCAGMIVRSPQAHGEYLLLSVMVAVASATIALILGALLGWLARPGGVRSAPALVAIALGLGLPAPLIGIFVIRLMNQPSVPWLVELYDRSIVPLVAAQMLRVLPATVWILWQAFRSIPRETIESAQLDGAGAIRLVTQVAIPLRRGAIVIAWLIAMCFAFGELGASILVAPPGMITAPIHLFNLLHFGVEDQVASLCIAIWGVYAVATGAIVLIARRWNRGG